MSTQLSTICGECNIDFRIPALLRRHIARYAIDTDSALQLWSYAGPHAHGNEFVCCELCMRVFSSTFRLRTHARLCRGNALRVRDNQIQQ